MVQGPSKIATTAVALETDWNLGTLLTYLLESLMDEKAYLHTVNLHE